MERFSTTRDLADGSATDPTLASPRARFEASEQPRRRSEPTERLQDGPPGPAAVDGRRLVLERYRLQRRLGAGGFGVVWLAFDEKLQREVAVKVIAHEGDHPIPPRAEREARVAARLNHPGIVGLYELAADDDAVYLVSELVPGRTLAELQRAGALSDRDIARIGIALCDALSHAHQRRVIHRDVKPQNVLVVAEPAAGEGFAKLADFGVAHLASGDPLTRTGDVVGTLAYMAPEQAEGARVSSAADVYSLALTLYECWSGTNPVRANGPVATARRLGTALPPIGRFRREIPEELQRALDASLDPDPDRRPPLRALRSALAAADASLSDAGGLVEPRTRERVGLPRSPGRPPLRLPRGRTARLLTRLAAALAAAALVVAAIGWVGAQPPLSLLALASCTAFAVALLPRIGWLLAAGALIVWLAAPPTGMTGTALILCVAVACVPALLPRAGVLWSIPVLAPLLGAIALGPVFIALSGFARTFARRAGLAAAGFVWLTLAELASGRTLLFGHPTGVTDHARWDHSLSGAIAHALKPLIASTAFAPLLAWAAFAAALPLLVRGRTLGYDIAGASLWAAALLVVEHAVGRVVASSGELTDGRGAAIGAVLGAALALCVSGAARARRAREAQ